MIENEPFSLFCRVWSERGKLNENWYLVITNFFRKFLVFAERSKGIFSEDLTLRMWEERSSTILYPVASFYPNLVLAGGHTRMLRDPYLASKL